MQILENFTNGKTELYTIFYHRVPIKFIRGKYIAILSLEMRVTAILLI